MHYWKQYLLNNDVDVCCVSETHFNNVRSTMFREAFEDKYMVFLKSRSDMKDNDKGSGGIAVLIKKNLGEANEIKRKREDGLLWIKLIHEGRVIYIASIYILPAGAVRTAHNDRLWEQLGSDIIEYKCQ